MLDAADQVLIGRVGFDDDRCPLSVAMVNDDVDPISFEGGFQARGEERWHRFPRCCSLPWSLGGLP